MFSINQPLFLQKTKSLYPNPKYLFGIWNWIRAAKNQGFSHRDPRFSLILPKISSCNNLSRIFQGSAVQSGFMIHIFSRTKNLATRGFALLPNSRGPMPLQQPGSTGPGDWWTLPYLDLIFFIIWGLWSALWPFSLHTCINLYSLAVVLLLDHSAVRWKILLFSR